MKCLFLCIVLLWSLGCAARKSRFVPRFWTAPLYDAIAVDGTCKFTVFVQKEDRSIVKEDKEIPEDTIWRGKTKDGREARFICYSGFDKKIKPWRPDED